MLHVTALDVAHQRKQHELPIWAAFVGGIDEPLYDSRPSVRLELPLGPADYCSDGFSSAPDHI